MAGLKVSAADLPGKRSRSFVGEEHGAGLTLILVDMPPGGGPRLHRHPYEEIFVVLDGTATFTVGDEEVAAAPEDILVVPPGTPHKFVNTGVERLRMTAIHHAPAFDTEWLE
jgi:mannose-6-phosphate isomerase-like protein (cupin superfamily)